MLLTEVLNSSYQWNWILKDDYEWVASFETPRHTYHVTFVQTLVDKVDYVWDIEFKVLNSSSRFGIIGGQPSAQVFSTVINIIKAFAQHYKGYNAMFHAKEASRVSLYNALVKRYIPNVDIRTDSGGVTYEFVL